MIGNNTSSGTVQEIRDVVALGASLVGLIYVSGVLIMALRLSFEELPPFAAVGSILKETAITIGLAQVFAPAVALGVAFLIWITTRIRKPKPHYERFSEARGVAKVRLWLTIAAGAVFTALPGAIVSFRTYHGVQELHYTLVFPLITGAVVTAGYIHVRARIRERARTAGEQAAKRAQAEGARGKDLVRQRDEADAATWRDQTSMFLRAALFAVATIPAIITVDSAVRLSDAHVCFRPSDSVDTTPLSGKFVTQTADSVFVGDDDGDKRRLHVLSADVVAQVSVGPSASDASCQLSERASAPGGG